MKACNDGNPCTQDSCNPSFAGGCQYEAQSGALCDDGLACTADDACDEGSCEGVDQGCECDVSADCQDDGNLCNGTPFCDKSGVPFTCEIKPDTVVSCAPPAGFSEDCTAVSCNPVTGQCETTLVNEGSSCNTDDGDKCTVNGVCVTGKCQGSTPDCNDGKECTNDGCDPAIGCTWTYNTATCDDGNKCTTGDKCSGGSCLGGGNISCDDNNACTYDSCNAATGCDHSKLNLTPCNDNNACTEQDSCTNGQCTGGTSKDCTDGDDCTDESCDPTQGCLIKFNTAACEDGLKCTVGDKCQAGACTAGPVKSCNDDNACTDDSCNPATGQCQTVNNSANCDDGNACTVGDVCSEGTCAGSGNPACCLSNNDCDDGLPCTTDSCNTQTGFCTHSPASGTPCNADNDGCTAGDFCSAGNCVAGDPVDCSSAADTCNTAACTGTGISSFLCGKTPKSVGTPCNDGKFCTTGDACDASGVCIGPDPLDCSEASGGCIEGACDEANDQCSGDPVPDGTPCNADDNGCTDQDSCVAGDCVQGGLTDCSVPGDPCTAYSCKSTGPFEKECTSAAKGAGAPCEDGLFCTENDGCDGFGACQSGTQRDCSSANDSCNVGACDEPTESCLPTPVTDGTKCTDSDACTTQEACQSGVCLAGGNLCGEHKVSTFNAATGTNAVWGGDATGGRYPIMWKSGNKVYGRWFDKDWSREWTESKIVDEPNTEVFAAASYPSNSNSAGTTVVAFTQRNFSNTAKTCYDHYSYSSCQNGSCSATSYSYPYTKARTKYNYAHKAFLRLRWLDSLGKVTKTSSDIWIGTNVSGSNKCSQLTMGTEFTNVRVTGLLSGDAVVVATHKGTEKAFLVSAAGAKVKEWTLSGAAEYDVAGFADSSFLIVKTAGGTIAAQRYTQAGAPQGTEFNMADAAIEVRNPTIGVQEVTGNYVVAWESEDAGGEFDVHAQVFKQDDSKLALAFQINAADGHHKNPKVGVFTNGSFAVAWQAEDNASTEGVWARFYNKNGAVLTDPQLVNISVAGSQRWHSAHGTADGHVAIAWTDEGNSKSVFARKYTQSGVAVDSVQEDVVNETSEGGQTNADVDSAPDGSYVVVWEDTGLDGDTIGIAGARFGPDGAKLGTKADFVVNQTTANAQKSPAIAVNALGGFVVAWDSFTDLTDLEDVAVRVYGADGVATTDEILVNEFAEDSQQTPAVAWQGTSSFAVVWESFLQPGGASFDTMIRCYNAGGTPVKSEQFVNTLSTAGMQQRPKIAATSAGGGRYMIVWDSFVTDWNVQARLFASSACAPLDAVIDVNTTQTLEQSNVDVAARADGQFIVVWQSDGQDGSSFGVYGQLFNELGEKQGGELNLNTITAAEQGRPSVTALSGNHSLVTWRTLNEDEDGFAVKARRFDDLMKPVGNDWAANLFTAGDQTAPVQAALPNGGYVVVWHGPGQDGDGTGIVQRRFPEPQNAE